MADEKIGLEEKLSKLGEVLLLEPPSDAQRLLALLDLSESLLSDVDHSPPPSILTALDPLRIRLLDVSLSQHPDVDVRVAAASCICQIIRILAPTAPYEGMQMKGIIRMFVDAFGGLDEVHSLTYPRRISILRTMSSAGIHKMMLDLKCEELILQMFRHFFSNVSEKNYRDVMPHMEIVITDILQKIDDYPLDILTCLLDNVKRDGEDIACTLAEKVIESCATKLKPYLLQAIDQTGASIGDYSGVIVSMYQDHLPTSGKSDHSAFGPGQHVQRSPTDQDASSPILPWTQKDAKRILAYMRSKGIAIEMPPPDWRAPDPPTASVTPERDLRSQVSSTTASSKASHSQHDHPHRLCSHFHVPPTPQGGKEYQDTRPLLVLLPNGRDFENSNKISREITAIIKDQTDIVEYRWCRFPIDEHNRLFDIFLRKFRLPHGLTKEHYRRAFTISIERRLSDTFSKARKESFRKSNKEEVDYEEMKRFPPTWCPVKRWAAFCDMFASDPEFARRSMAGKTNRQKQEIRSTSGSKSHNQVRAELAAQLQREPLVCEWWSKTHKHGRGDQETWSTPAAGAVLDRYQELYKDKWGDTSADDQPKFDPLIWKQVSDERLVGAVSRRQGLGGLHPRYMDPSATPSITYQARSQGPCNQHAVGDHSCRTAIIGLSQRMASLDQKISQLVESQTLRQKRIVVDNDEGDDINTEEDERMIPRQLQKKRVKGVKC